MNAQAVVFTKPNAVEFRDVTVPKPPAGDAVIRVTHSWISNGTEGSYLRGERIGGDTPYKPGDASPFPLVPGYQKIGVVESVGEEIKDLKPGETVFCACGQIENMFTPWGGHVSPSISPRSQIWKLPAGPVEPLAFAPLLLAQVGYNCGSRAPVKPGQFALVFGDGMVAMWAAQTLAHRGAKPILVGQDAWRLALAQKLIGCQPINMTTDDWAPRVRAIAPDGLAVAVDAVGTRSGTETVINLMIRCGHIVSAGFCGRDDRISLQSLRDGELSLDSVSGMAPERMDRTLELIAQGAIKTLPLITHRFPVRRAADAWQVISARAEPVLGVVLDW